MAVANGVSTQSSFSLKNALVVLEFLKLRSQALK